MWDKTPILLGNSDFKIIKEYLEQFHANPPAHIESLAVELREAIVVADDILPETCVRLNSDILVKDSTNNNFLEFSIVIPENADSGRNKVSVFEPLGSRFIGLCKTEKIEIEMEGKMKYFQIVEVKQQTMG